MPLTKPPLSKVTPGLPLTAGGWNAVVSGIEGLYDGLNQVGRDYIEISITFRGQPVRDARIVCIRVDSGSPTGPALAAVPPVGDRTSYQLVGITPGMWNVAIAAEGFAATTASVQVGAIAAKGPSASTQVELKRTTVPVPDLVGLTTDAAGFFLKWTGLPRGISTSVTVGTDARNHYILMQGPSDGEVPHGTAVNLWSSTAETPNTNQVPSRTVVPDLLGLPGDFAYAHATTYFLFTKGQETGTGNALKVTAQDPLPGQFVAPGMALSVRYSPTDANTNFEVYPATHAALAKIPVQDVLTAMNGSTGLAFVKVQDILFAPWVIARTYLTDDTLNAILDFFGRFSVSVSDPSKDLPAIWESLLVAYHLGRA